MATIRLPGARLLQREIERRGLQRQQVAEALGVSPSTVTQILAGNVGVGLDLAVAIHNWSEGRVPWLSFVSAPERRQFRRSWATTPVAEAA